MREAWVCSSWIRLYHFAWYVEPHLYLFLNRLICIFAGIGLEYVLLVSSGVFYFLLLAIIESSLFRKKSDGQQRSEDASDSMYLHFAFAQ